MYGYNALRVVESKSAAYKPGDRIVAGLGWKSHGIVHADHVYNRIEEGVDPTQALSVLGFTGLTAVRVFGA